MRQQVQGVKTWVRLMKWGEYTGCHQRFDRSLYWKGFQLPLCARCTGILIGQLLAIPLFFIFTPSLWVLALLLPLALDGITQLAGLRESNNWLRLGTGILGGYANISFIILAATFVLHKYLPFGQT